MFCIHCGKELPGAGDFCPYCGGRQGAPKSGDGAEKKPDSAKNPSLRQKRTSPEKASPAGGGKAAGRKRWKWLAICLGVAAAAAALCFIVDSSMSARKTKCPDPERFFELAWESGHEDFDFLSYYSETAVSSWDAETVWDAMEEYEDLLEDYGAEASLERESDEDNTTCYRLEADFGRCSLADAAHRTLALYYYPPEGRFFLLLYHLPAVRIVYVETDAYDGAVSTRGGTDEPSGGGESGGAPAEGSGGASQSGSGGAAAHVTDTAVPDFQAFCENNLHEFAVTEHSDHTEYCYFWKYNGKALDEYIALLQESYHFRLRGTKTIESINSYRYSFDYTGPGPVDGYDEDGMNGSDGDGIALYIWDLHASPTEGEVHICLADGLDYMDTGDRTTRTITPYESGSGSGGSSSGGEGDCWYCNGDGVCPTCGGSGKVYNWLPGTREYVLQECTDCYSPGKCRVCGGSGDA